MAILVFRNNALFLQVIVQNILFLETVWSHDPSYKGSIAQHVTTPYHHTLFHPSPSLMCLFSFFFSPLPLAFLLCPSPTLSPYIYPRHPGALADVVGTCISSSSCRSSQFSTTSPSTTTTTATLSIIISCHLFASFCPPG